MDVVVLCYTDKWYDWERLGFWGRRSKIAKKLSEREEIEKLLVINTPTSIFSSKKNGVAKTALPEAANFSKRGLAYRAQEKLPGVFIFDHFRLLPRERHNAMSFEINGVIFDRYLIRSVRKVMEELRMRDVVLWINGPLPAKYIGCFGEKLAVYDAADEWLYHPKHQHLNKEIKASYELIREKADLVFAVTPELVKTFSGSKPVSYLMPNGIDSDHLRKEDNTVVPKDISGIKKPIVGYLGALQERIDVDIVYSLAESMKDVSFVFVGPMLSKEHFRSLIGLPNVFFLGIKKNCEVHSYIKAFDVCIMPHVDNNLTRNMDPAKLYEYLASYKPVISTDLPTVLHFGSHIRRASNAKDFENFIKEALSDQWQVDKSSIEEFINSNTWSERIDNIISVMQESLKLDK